jgi:predicted enzyme related to lactoylglutathione lyase
MEETMNPVVHFEMPAKDKKRMADFYTKAFGWKTQMLGPDMNEYVLVTTTEPDENGRPKNPGAINGGFYKKSANMPAQYPSVVIGVGDIKEAIKKVMEAGGKVLGRANGDTRLRPLRLVFRHGRQPREYDAAKIVNHCLAEQSSKNGLHRAGCTRRGV